MSLTPKGRALFEMLLESASAEAGRPLVSEDLLEALRRVRAENGIESVDFRDPEMVDCLKKHIRAIDEEGSGHAEA